MHLKTQAHLINTWEHAHKDKHEFTLIFVYSPHGWLLDLTFLCLNPWLTRIFYKLPKEILTHETSSINKHRYFQGQNTLYKKSKRFLPVEGGGFTSRVEAVVAGSVFIEASLLSADSQFSLWRHYCY